MVRFFARILVAFAANTFAFTLAAKFIPGFALADELVKVLEVAAILTAINFFVKPFLKLVFSPVIILTLGIGLIFMNAALLKFLDFLSEDLTIQGIQALIYATLLMSAVNFVVHAATKRTS